MNFTKRKRHKKQKSSALNKMKAKRIEIMNHIVSIMKPNCFVEIKRTKFKKF